MKKEMIVIIICSVLFLFLSSILLGSFGVEPFIFVVKSPLLSPLFPIFGPFNATVTIKWDFAPVIENLSDEIFVCEGQALSKFFNVTDMGGGPLDLSISPFSPFFVEPIYIPRNPFKTKFDARLFSLILDKSRVNRALGYRLYERVISASNGRFTDSKNVNITVIEINNAPIIAQIGARTLWTRGDNTTLYYQVRVNDVEDGDQNSGNFTFSLVFLNGAPQLFNISANGSIKFIPNETLNLSQITLPITYNVSVCVRDRGIPFPHPRILQECNQTGLAATICENFSITITNENRAPIITDHFPFNQNLSVVGEQELRFNVSSRDPDGTIPDTYWYLDNSLMKRTVGSHLDYFTYSFACGIGGKHFMKVEVTDGLLNDSLQWNIDVTAVPCPASGGGGGGGGGGGMIKKCKENWACSQWNICQDIEASVNLGLLKGDVFRKIKEDCRLNFFNRCGFQIRDCFDAGYCNTSLTMPETITSCYYVENPSCMDSIKNCHDSSCEILVDCGGPCEPCPTCSDGLQNQGEFGVDCGGPCPIQCPVIPVRKIGIQVILILFLLLLLIIIIIESIRIYMEKRKIKENKIKI